MKFLLVIAFVFYTFVNYGQSMQQDLGLIGGRDFVDSSMIRKPQAHYVFKNSNAFVKYNPLSLTFGGALLFYQRVVSRQIMMGCAFNPSCSNFSKQCLHKFGLVKGIALSADRLTRCTKLSAADFHPVMFAENGKVNDFPEYYRLREKK